MKTKRVLVSGAGGFIGRQALKPLLELGFEVHAVSRAEAPEAARIPGVQWHAADLLLPDSASALMEKVRPSHLLHFAWYAEHGKFWDSPLNLAWLAATLLLLEEFARAGGKRFVGAGTCAEYEWNGELCDETKTPLRPATLYGTAKASAFAKGFDFAKAKGFSFAWGRVFNLFGPGESPARIVPALIRAHLSGETLNCSQGTQVRDFLPVSAVAEAFARLCAGGAEGAFNIGSGQGMTLKEISEKIALAAGREGDIRFGSFQDQGPKKLLPLVERITRETIWRPPASLDVSLAEAVLWWKEPRVSSFW